MSKLFMTDTFIAVHPFSAEYVFYKYRTHLSKWPILTTKKILRNSQYIDLWTVYWLQHN